ncbi:MAG: molybdopterin-dependent oxidoreductase [Chloroflexota bacterium]|nr:molybdopterin-dependent oxidoreductase [Chloroflexota bacterium]
MSSGTKGPRISRRQVLQAGALTAGGVLLGDCGYLTTRSTQPGPQGSFYPLDDPNAVIHTTCLQCNTQCTLKVKLQDGIVAKIDGNPYSPMNLLPSLPYAQPLAGAARVDGSVCPKGQDGVQTLYDPYRLRTVLKRAGPRGSGKWRSIPFDQAIREIVDGGPLFADLGEARNVTGLRDIMALRDPALAKQMAADVGAVRSKTLSVAAFQAKHRDHLDVLIDPDHPDLGPKNNQFVMLGGRIAPDREKITQRFTFGSLGSVNWYGHTTICEQAHHIAFLYATAQWAGKDGWKQGTNHMKPDYTRSEFVIFWGTGFSEANFGPNPMSIRVAQALVDAKLKVAVIDPRLSKSAAKGWWIPVRPGGDLALAMGMIRRIIDEGRYDGAFLRNANAAAATAGGERSWTNATWLVDPATGRFLRADAAGVGSPQQFVALVGGAPTAVDPGDKTHAVVGDLDASATVAGVAAKTSFRLLRESAQQHDLAFYAKESGLEEKTIVDLATELTAHGKKAAIDFYRGPIKLTYGYYSAQAIITLNYLIGNVDHVGGLVPGGGSWDGQGGQKGQPFPLDALHPGALTKFGVKLNREASGSYESSTLFSGYPAKRPWYPLTGDVYQEVIPAAYAGYPYPIKMLWLHYGTPALAAPAGHLQIAMLRDVDRLPLVISTDIVIGETSMYADYLFPDFAYLERWSNAIGTSPVVLTKITKFRQPAAAPLTATVRVDGAEMPLGMDTVLIALAKALGASGFGKDALGPGRPLDRPEDYYLKMVANLAAGDGPGDEVPPASDADMTVFRAARAHLPASVFDESRWQASAGESWPRVVTVLTRGGRFEDTTKAYTGGFAAHSWGKLLDLYAEPVATTTDSMTGERFSGVPVYQTLRSSDGQPVTFPTEYDLDLFTYKEIWGTQSRTVGNYAAQMSLMPENFVYLNVVDARRLGFADGTPVRLESPGFGGSIDLGSGAPVVVQGRVKTVQGVRPGSVAISFHYGHWAYGARDVTIDGQVVPGEPVRGKGLAPNPAMSVDRHLKDVALTDPIAGDSAFNGTRVRLVRVGDPDTRGLPGAGSYLLVPPVVGSVPADDARWLQEQGLRAARGEHDPGALRAEIEARLGRVDRARVVQPRSPRGA